ncbi:LLM class flavin-dependent oxidoreductase [Aeromicrobium massiliense]|uniref:LLM class flavin-dependent oxidoreductase n=1 Tax=Aeromicrobium massiliense TaxID=1464554 RepID=UPI0002FDD7C0|nr:LLM class flavin-dependent oxidoreductase [Aeromicrobium massiliense]
MTRTPVVDAVMSPDQVWTRSATEWRLAEEMGVGRGWIYDHLNLQPQHERWHEATTHLAAAAATTTRIGVGTMVTTPNFRHPAPSAKAALTLHDVSAGRFVLGVGAGGPGADSDALGGPVLERRDRMSRLAEWTEMLRRLLDGGTVDADGRFTTVRFTVVTAQRDRTSAAGRRGHGCGRHARGRRARRPVDHSGRRAGPARVRGHGRGGDRAAAELLDETCAAAGRDPSSLPRLVVLGYGSERPLESEEAFRDALGRYGELGAATVAVLWPRGEGATRHLDVLAAVLGR